MNWGTSDEFSDAAIDLFAQIADPNASDYAVIDLGEGGQWLTSRLFVFAELLRRRRNLRCLV